MRTRNSWRNQNILFRELFAPKAEPRETLDEVARAERMLLAPVNARTRRMLERDLAAAKHRRAVRACLSKR